MASILFELGPESYIFDVAAWLAAGGEARPPRRRSSRQLFLLLRLGAFHSRQKRLREIAWPQHFRRLRPALWVCKAHMLGGVAGVELARPPGGEVGLGVPAVLRGVVGLVEQPSRAVAPVGTDHSRPSEGRGRPFEARRVLSGPSARALKQTRALGAGASLGVFEVHALRDCGVQVIPGHQLLGHGCLRKFPFFDCGNVQSLLENG